MEREIIKQIIPAPLGVFAVYLFDDRIVKSPIVCFSLTELDGMTAICPMDITIEDGLIEDVNIGAENFLGIEYPGIITDWDKRAESLKLVKNLTADSHSG